jgi:gamma-glutamyltranspeptidase/glutathione hydrolase
MPRRFLAASLLLVPVLWASHSTLRGASRAPVRAASGMVGSADSHASETGLAILRQGGNAVDAAVAMGFVLAVTYPGAGNLGGGGFMVIRLADGRETTIDYRETAPARAHRDMFLDSEGNAVAAMSRNGPLAAGIPGSVAGLTLAQERYGRLSLAEVIAPAIMLARDGFAISRSLSEAMAGAADRLQRFDATTRVFFPDGKALPPGHRLVQPDLARTLTSIAEQGPHAFYRGAIARMIADEMTRSGGVMTLDDLAAYRAVERPPVVGTFREHRIVSMAPPSSGGIALVQLLNILEAYPLAEYGHNASRTIHLMAEAERRTFADRSAWLGDPAYYRVPMTGLTSKAYAARLRETVSETRATPSEDVRPGRPAEFESSETTHYSVVDAAGNAVSTTTTLNGTFGNGQMVPGAGFLLNNEMDDFSAKPGSPNMFGLLGGEANEIAPGKRMLSSMTPTIVTRDGRTVLVLGSPGGGRIITTVLQVLLNVIEFGFDVQEAVDAPRFHHQWQPDVIRLERVGFPRDVVDALAAMGHRTEVQQDMGDVHVIQIDPSSGLRFGASDPRQDGQTLGY